METGEKKFDGFEELVLELGMARIFFAEEEEEEEEARIVVSIKDITERKQAEEKLGKSQEQLRDAHRLAHIGIWNWIADTDTVTWTEELYRIAGLDPMIPAPTYAEHSNIYAPESWDRLKVAVEKALETGAHYQLELELIRPDGTTRWVNAFGGATYDNHGRVTGLHGTVQDITERKKAEEDIKRRNDELLALNAIAATVNSSLDLQEILGQGLDKTLEVTGLEVGSVYLLDQKTEDLVLVTYRGASEEYADQMRTFKMGESLVGKVAQTGEPIVVDDLTRDPRVTTTLVTKEKMCSFAGIPIKSKERVQGVMNTASRQYHPFSPGEIRLYTAIADLLAAAIENARLYEVVKKELTERKQAQNALAKSEALLREAQEVAHIGHWELDTSIMTPTWSEEIFHIFGLDPEKGEPSFEAHQKVTHPDDWGIFNNAMTTSIAEGIPFDIEFRILLPDKTIRWMHAIGYPKKDSEGRIVSVFGTAQDITDRKLMEDVLRASEENFRRSLEDSPLGVRIVTIEGETVYANRAMLNIYGYDSIEELRTTPVKKRYTPESCAEFQIRMEKRRKGDHDPFEYEVNIVRKNGEVRYLQVFRKEILWNGEKQFQTIYQDITDRKRAEEELRESEERYRILTEKTIAGIYLIQDGLFKYVNPTFCEIHGYTQDELVDKFGPLDLVVEEEKGFLNDKIQQRLSEEKESDQFSIRIRKKDGEISFLEVFSSYALYAGKPAVLGTCIDITETRKANEAIKKSREELRALTAYLQNIREEERIRISREIHDELGQLLTGIKIDISWLKKKLADTVKPTDPIQTKIDFLLGLTDSVIATTRELSLSLRPGILDDLGLVAAINWEMKRFQEKTGITCTFQSDMAETAIPEDHTTALFRICQECLTNIVRHAHATEVNVTLTEKGGNLVLEIEDNGKGITTEQKRSPISLGLLGMRERIVGLVGRFSIRGAPGKGTKVKVEVPVR